MLCVDYNISSIERSHGLLVIESETSCSAFNAVAPTIGTILLLFTPSSTARSASREETYKALILAMPPPHHEYI